MRSLAIAGMLLGAVQPVRADLLDELIARSRTVDAWRATYSLKFALAEGSTARKPEDGEMSIDFSAPDKLRVENRMGSRAMVMWCVGGRITTLLSGESAKGALFGAVDLAALRRGFAPFESAFEAAYPEAKPRGRAFEGPAAMVDWSFDERSQRANFNVAAVAIGSETSFGWLDTLERKNAALTVDGDRATFETDGRFTGELDAQSGRLKRLDGSSPNGRFEFLLQSWADAPSSDGAPFDAPRAVEGARDTSAELRRATVQNLHDAHRGRVYAAVAAEPNEGDDARSKAYDVLLSLHTHSLALSLESWFELAQRKTRSVAERLESFRESGLTREQAEEQRRIEIGSLRKQLDELEQTFEDRLELNERLRRLSRAEIVQQLERRAFAEAFEQRVRAPVMADFEAATKAD